MNITNDFPVGTRIVIEVVDISNGKEPCENCVLDGIYGCGNVRCRSNERSDKKKVNFKIMEVEFP